MIGSRFYTHIILGASLTIYPGCFAVAAQDTPKRHAKAAPKLATATWSPDVETALGVSSTDFRTTGLNKLTPSQLQALEEAVKRHPYFDATKKLLTCARGPLAPGAHARVFLTVDGEDPEGLRAAEILRAVRSLPGVDLADTAADADRILHVVVQELTLKNKTIGYTASYVTATPCVSESDSGKTDVELKGQLGNSTNSNGADLARNLAAMLAEDIQTIRATARK
ncbi:MAG: hypothetical protein FWD64_00280 [Acidobacteriaceae bacterium]|nr:hypothetical protein [Acidobacteriaceae bacterium]